MWRYPFLASLTPLTRTEERHRELRASVDACFSGQWRAGHVAAASSWSWVASSSSCQDFLNLSVVLQRQEHITHVDTDGVERVEHRPGRLGCPGDGVCGDHAVVGDRVDVFSGMVFTVCGAMSSVT